MARLAHARPKFCEERNTKCTRNFGLRMTSDWSQWFTRIFILLLSKKKFAVGVLDLGVVHGTCTEEQAVRYDKPGHGNKCLGNDVW